MRQAKYLNGILTVNAVLLAGLLWTQVADGPILSQTAEASAPPKRNVPTFPNASDQRMEIVRSVRSLEKKVVELNSMLKAGKMKVEVTNLKDIEVSVSDGDGGRD